MFVSVGVCLCLVVHMVFVVCFVVHLVWFCSCFFMRSLLTVVSLIYSVFVVCSVVCLVDCGHPLVLLAPSFCCLPLFVIVIIVIVVTLFSLLLLPLSLFLLSWLLCPYSFCLLLLPFQTAKATQPLSNIRLQTYVSSTSQRFGRI